MGKVVLAVLLGEVDELLLVCYLEQLELVEELLGSLVVVCRLAGLLQA